MDVNPHTFSPGTLSSVSGEKCIFPELRNKYYVEKLEIHISYLLKFFENFVFCEIILKKYIRAEQATNDHMEVMH
jgi:hypothetical protein